ncbi:response regulator [Cohnella cellulosilytica]|uniref:Response regulator n=1 Tax=Cohnella cellulosilytica TaxID=986710 RepID=A0ABW2F830_9BACL
MKLKALLIDDEVNILKNLQAVIPWEELNIELIGAARNGEQALELAREQRPQLILCDIRMPVMDGIEFLGELRRFDPDAEVIMMTGYQDFSYVRSVIRYEVKDYILKPIDYEELAETIRRLADAVRERSLERSSLQQEWKQMLHLVYEKALYDRIADLDGSAGGPLFKLGELQEEHLAFAMMLVDVADYSKRERFWDDKERKLWNFAINNILQENLAAFGVSYSVIQVRSGEWSVLIERSAPDLFEREQGLAWAEALRQAVWSYLKLRIRVALHPAEVTLRQLSKTYKSLQRSLYLSPAAYEGVIVSERARGSFDTSQQLWDTIEEMVTGLKRCDRRRTETALKELNESFRSLPENSFERVAPIVHYLCIHLLREMREMEVMTRDEETEIWRQIDRHQGIRETLLVVNRLVDQSIESVMKKKTSDVLMLSAKDYIERNLSAELSIDILAEYLGISGSYFSLLFKQHFGETFVEYVTKQRMEMARSLLALSDKSVTQVGQMVGYAERRYFTRVFSKYTGMLPSEYRERQQSKSGTDKPAWTNQER